MRQGPSHPAHPRSAAKSRSAELLQLGQRRSGSGAVTDAAAVYGFDLDALAPLAAEHGPAVGEVATPLDAIPADAMSPAFQRD